MYEDESGPVPLDAPHGSAHNTARRRFWRFDPTISTGTIALGIELLIGGGLAYGIYTADKKETKMEIVQLQKDRQEDRETTKEVVRLLSNKMDQVQTGLYELRTDIAVLKQLRGVK